MKPNDSGLGDHSHVPDTLVPATSPPSSTGPNGHENEDSWWTVVNVAEPEDSGENDSDKSVVEISRVSSPLTVQFNSLKIPDHVNVFIPWPSSLPWFQFQDRYLSSAFARDMFVQQFRPKATGPDENNGGRSVVLATQHLQKHTTPEGLSLVISEISKSMPEKFEGENAARVEALVGSDQIEAKQKEFQIFAYQLSNNLIEDEDDEYIDYEGKFTKIIEIFRSIDLPLLVWKDLFAKSLEQPTGRAFLEALFEAAVNTQSLDVCEALLESGANPDKIIWTWATGEFERPIQLAMDCRVHNLDLVKLLIRFGAGVDLITEDDAETALHKAAMECTLESVQVLVEAGASLTASDGPHYQVPYNTALTKAVDADFRMSHLPEEKQEARNAGKERRGLGALKYLLPLYKRDCHHEIIQSGLIRAASGGRRDMIVLLIDAGADVNETSPSGYTPLVAASEGNYKGNNVSTASMLLEFGADPNLPFKHWSGSGICAIHIAAAKGEEKLVQLLIDHGANTDTHARPRTEKHASLLGYQFRSYSSRPPHFLKDMARCKTPLQLALYRNKATESYNIKTSDAALVLVRAGATLVGGELARAASFDNIDLVRELLSRGADINEMDWTGRSALQTCLEFENINLVRCLLEAGAKLHGSELFAAVKAGSRETVDMLLQHGATVDKTDGSQSFLEAAALSKNWKLMEWLMESHAVLYDPGALCAAVCSGLGSSKDNEGYLVALLKRRQCDETGGPLEDAAIGYAAFHRQGWVLSHLLELKTVGTCIIPLKGDGGYYNLVKGYLTLKSYGYKEQFWHDSAMIRCSVLLPFLQTGNWGAVSQLLRAGYQPDRLSLLVAIKRHPLEQIYSLTQRMDLVDISQAAQSNLDTPLQAAARFQRIEVVRHLLSLGVDVNASASKILVIDQELHEPLLPRTALQAAVEHGDLDMIDLLIDAGADVNAPPARDSGATALQIAAGNGQIGIARKLIALGADVNADGAYWSGRTALEVASERGRLDMVQFLLESGARTTEAGYRSGLRAVRFSRENGHETVASLLRVWRKREKTGCDGQGIDARDLSSDSSESYGTSGEEENDDSSPDEVYGDEYDDESEEEEEEQEESH